MNKINSLKSWHGLMLMLMMLVSFTSCTDDEKDSEAPYLDVTPISLVFSEGETNKSIEISTNRMWEASVEDNLEWITLSKNSGEGSATIQVSIPEGQNGEGKINITISNQTGVLKSVTVNVTAGTTVASEVIYNETIGTGDATEKPYISDYTAWTKTGIGATNVEYEGNKTSVRATGIASTDAYSGASGSNNVFFGTAPADFIIKKIALTAEQTNLKLTFGASRSKNDNGTYDNTFNTENFKVYIGGDGSKWSELTYEKNNGDADHPYWIFATSDFTLKKSVSELYIKFTASESSVYRLDDITLSTGTGGQEIDVEAGSTDPEEPGEAEVITIAEIISMMSSEGTVIDASADRYFEAVVQCDVEGGNCTNGNLPVAIENATAEKSAVTLYGSQVDPNTLGLVKGDKIKITLKAGLAKAQLYGGLYEVTGGKDETWCTIEKIGTSTITPVVISDTDQLINYQGMTVTVNNSQPKENGRKWGDGTHTFISGGKEFTVYAKNTCAFAATVIDNTKTGSVTGVVTLYKGAAQIAPRNIDDVNDFTGEGTVDPEPGEEGEFTSMSPFLFDNGTDMGASYEAQTNVNGTTVSGIKFGTSSKSGAFESGALGVTGDKTLTFYAVAWKAKKCSLFIQVNNGGSVNGTNSVELKANDGATGNSPYTISFSGTDKYTLSLTGLTENSTITIATDASMTSASNSNARAVICGINLE